MNRAAGFGNDLSESTVGMTNTVIVLPTYNEAGNVRKVVEAIQRQVIPHVRDNVIMLFVDGNSPDGTAEVVKDLMHDNAAIQLIVEKEKGGIGQAYITGFNYAMRRLNAEVVVEFDADLQHPPEALVELLRKLENGMDFVIGSRRIRGGSFPLHWDRRRLFLSKFGGFVARVLLFFPRPCFFRITDPTSGLRATRVHDVLDSIDLECLRARGFGYKIELIHKITLVTSRIAEVPLRFEERSFGVSKMTSRTAKEVFAAAIRARIEDPWTRQFMKFATVGFIGLVVNAVSLEVIRQSGVFAGVRDWFAGFGNESAWSAALAAEISILNNYVLNDFWTWRDRRTPGFGRFLSRAFQFNVAAIGAIVIQFAAIWAITSVFGDTMIVRQLGLISAVLILVLPYNWLIQKRVIWRIRPPANTHP